MTTRRTSYFFFYCGRSHRSRRLRIMCESNTIGPLHLHDDRRQKCNCDAMFSGMHFRASHFRSNQKRSYDFGANMHNCTSNTGCSLLICVCSCRFVIKNSNRQTRARNNKIKQKQKMRRANGGCALYRIDDGIVNFILIFAFCNNARECTYLCIFAAALFIFYSHSVVDHLLTHLASSFERFTNFSFSMCRAHANNKCGNFHHLYAKQLLITYNKMHQRRASTSALCAFIVCRINCLLYT